MWSIYSAKFQLNIISNCQNIEIMWDTSCFGHQLKPFHSKSKRNWNFAIFLGKNIAQKVPLDTENTILATLAENVSLKRQKMENFHKKKKFKKFFFASKYSSRHFPGCHLRDIQRWSALFQNNFRSISALFNSWKYFNSADSALINDENENFQS